MQEDLLRFEQYLRRRYGDRSTPKHYLSDLKLFFGVIGSKAAREVSAHDVDCFIDDQVQRGLRPATINRRVASLHSFFEFLASLEPDQSWPNPVHWRRHGVKQGLTVPRDAQDGQVAQLFAVIEDVRDRAVFGLMVGAGLRVGEVVSLRCHDLEPPPSPDQGARLRVRGKGHKERIVWVTPYWYGVVTAWLAQRPQAASKHLFLNQHDRPLSVSGIQFWLKQYCSQAGIELSCHQLRHTFARRLADQSMPIESISVLLGHAQVETTQRYTAGANPGLRDAFLASMASVPASPEPSVSSSPLPPAAAQAEVADPHVLEEGLLKLATLPPWLQDPLREYVCRRWRDWQPHMVAQNLRRLIGYLLQVWGDLLTSYPLHDWSDLQRSQVETWLATRAAAGLTPVSLCHELGLLFSCLRFALEQGHKVSTNILRIPFPARAKPLPRYLLPDQYQRLLTTVWEETAVDTPRAALDRAWFLTLAHTGVRSSELLNLRLADLDLASQRLFIRGGKNGDERVVYLTPALAEALTRYLAVRPNTRDNHLWIDDQQPLSLTKMRYRFQCWADAAQVPASPHRLRHTLATQLINNDMSITAVAKLLGHRTLDMTQHYARLYEHTVKDQFQAAFQRIEGVAVAEWPLIVSLPQPQIEQIVDSV